MTTDPAEAQRTRARARLGKILREKWRIDELLGVGGMAVVYSATHVNNGRRVAIKLLHPELGLNSEVRTRFLREGYAANKVEHPGTVAILDDEASDEAVFLVMELLDGETLEARRVRAGPALPPHEVLSIADRLLDVLGAAHAKGIVHRDIKPDNIFLLRDGSVKVLDFGIAKIRELQGKQPTLTAAGAIGTPAFMPPEQARGRWEQVGPWTDIWAVGATMFTLVTGRLVHQADTVNELMLAAMTKPAPPVASLVPGLPAPVAALVDRALAYDPQQRWPDAHTMQAALRKAYFAVDPAAGAGAYQTHPGPLPSFPAIPANVQPYVPAAMAPAALTIVKSQPSRSGPLIAIAGGMAAAIVCGVALWALLSRPGPEPATATAASAAPASASVTASAPASAAPSATAAPSASASAEPEAPADTAAASASAAPEATQAPVVPVRRPVGRPNRIIPRGPKKNVLDRFK